jgi:flagellar biogenesis protein FliO
MSAIFLGIIFSVLFCVLALLLMGAYLLSKLLGGFSNLKNLFSQLTGWGKENREKESAKT